MNSSIDVYIDVRNKPLAHSGAETSTKPLTRRGNSKGQETCCVCVESPARWGYAKAMESEKNCQKCHELSEKYEHIRANYEQMRANFERVNANYEQMKATYEQVHAKYEQVHAKCEQIHAKYEQVHAKYHQVHTKYHQVHAKFEQVYARYDQVHAMYDHKVVINEHKSVQCNASNCEQHVRMSRLPFVTACSFQASKKREREPSRIPYRKVFKLFRKKRVVRFAAKSYLQKYIPSSSKLKLMLFACNRYYVSERLGRSKNMYSLSLKNCYVRQNLYLSTGIMRARTIKHKKSPWFCIHVDDRMLMKLKYCQVQSYCVSHRVICLSGDIEENPGPSYQCSDKYASLAAHGVSVGNSVSLLETRLSDLNRTAFDVGGDGDCFFPSCFTSTLWQS